MNPMKTQATRNGAAVLFIVAVALFRLCTAFTASGGHLPWLENFAPVAAVALCGGIYLPRRVAFIIPVAALLVSDLVLNWHYNAPLLSWEMASRYAAIALTVGIGFGLRNRARLSLILPASVLGSLIFYVVTNTTSWLGTAAYAKTLAGWVQALTTGLPGYAPTWTFYRSTLLSDLLFTTLFVLCMSATAEPSFEIPASKFHLALQKR